MDIENLLNNFTAGDKTYNRSSYTEDFRDYIDNFLIPNKKRIENEGFYPLYSGKVYRVHQDLHFYKKGNKKGQLKIKENLKFTKKDFTHWSKNPQIYNLMFSDLHPKCSVFAPFLLIEGNVENGIDKNEIFNAIYEDYKKIKSSIEEEIIAPMNPENIEKIYLILKDEDKNNPNNWQDVTKYFVKE